MLYHHVRGDLCPGSGFPPLEREDARLEALSIDSAALARKLGAELIALYDARANFIPPALVQRYGDATALASRLRRRLDRHRAWPKRFANQIARQGWGDPPPAYLLERAK